MTRIEGFRNSKNPSKIGTEDWVKITGIKGFLKSKNRSKIGPKTRLEVP
jgi:hypothetical protein